MSMFALIMALASPDTFPASPPTPAVAPPPFIRAEPLPPPEPRRSPEPAAKPKLLNTLQVFRSENYPFWALQIAEEGTVRVEVQVSASGAARSCRVIESSGSEILDLGTCDLIMGHGRFAPARDHKGSAVAGILTKTVTWDLADIPQMPLIDARTRIVYVIDDKLQVSNCRVEQAPETGFDPRFCAEMRPTAQLMVASAPEAFEWDQWQVVLDASQFIGAGTASASVGKGKNQMLFDRSIIRMTVTPEGKIRRCDFIEGRGSPFRSKEQWCSQTMRDAVFTPATDQADRLVTSVTAVYLEKKF